MEKSVSVKENGVVTLQMITKLMKAFEEKVVSQNQKIKEVGQFYLQFEELRILKEKCCDNELIISSTAFHGIVNLVKKKILVKSQTVSMLISLLPTVVHYGTLVSAMGDILLLDLQEQISLKNIYDSSYSSTDLKHPLIIILNHNEEKSWFHIYVFILNVMESKSNEILLKHRINLLRPIFHYVFWNPNMKKSQFQVKLFNTLVNHFDQSDFINFTLELLIWQDLDINYCYFLKDFIQHLLKLSCDENDLVISAISPLLAVAIKWLILNGYDPSLWINLLGCCLEIDNAASTIVLYMLTDIVLETPSNYINILTDMCKSIIYSLSLNKYVAHKFLGVILNWFINPSSLVHPLYDSINKIVKFLNKENIEWNDGTSRLSENKYFKIFISTNDEIKFTTDLMLLCNKWAGKKNLLINWLKTLEKSNHYTIQIKLHTFLYGIILSENDYVYVEPCLNLLINLIQSNNDISFSLLCLLFYKLGKETDPKMQKIYVFSLPKLASNKENVPLIVGIIESFKKGCLKITIPIIIQLYLLLWKINKRTYSYLHRMLHDSSFENFNGELNLSKAIALREICRMEPFLHAKDLVGVLSKILNECNGRESGLASAIAIEAVTALCKCLVIEVTGTCNAITPKMRYDKRPQVIISLCKFFGEIPHLNTPEEKYYQLIHNVIPILWNYSFSDNVEIVKHSFLALSNFKIENLPLNLMPEIYRVDIKMPKDLDKGSAIKVEDILSLPYVPGECFVQLMQKLEDKVLDSGSNLLIVTIERELNSLPRSVFFIPLEKTEPSSYSYLPQKSICRAVVECIKKHAASEEKPPNYVKELIRIISHDYSKFLPPLNWEFVEHFLKLDSDFRCYCLSFLVKQGGVSKTAKFILENYMKSVEWDYDLINEILCLYERLSLLCKSVSYNILQSFLENTIDLAVEAALKENCKNFDIMLKDISKALKNSSVPPVHKALMITELEKIIKKIPPMHEIMESFALCATDFPIQSIENLTTVVKPYEENDDDTLHRSIIIRRAIAMREDIKAPLVWLSDSVDAATEFPSIQDIILNTIRIIIQTRRDCEFTSWMKELTWRIQEFISSSDSSQPDAGLFLIDLFMSSTIVLSGCDCFFADETEFIMNKSKIFEVFPQSLSILMSSPKWAVLLPKIAAWLLKLSKWKDLPPNYVQMIAKSLLTLKKAKNFLDESITANLFNFYFEEFL